ncbi:MAG TPA: LPS export ABC transporter periplasmic protein LptC [Pyrinomonadaceae bacterium]|nr:LPS export ABC transporter periplasmic protein LptC [Pyrinomonadaceae bacterium]
MQEVTRHRRASGIGIRARLPQLVRWLALVVLVASLAFAFVAYYKRRGLRDFRMRGGPAELSKEVVRRVEGYEHRETKNNRLYILLRAAVQTTYSDGHHELEDVHLEVYPEDGGERPDRVTARRTIMFDDNQRVQFAGQVVIETRDQLKARTEAIEYDIKNEVGVSPVPVEFERENVRGRADAATVDSKNKRLELRGGVEVTVQPEARPGAPPERARPVTVRSAQANFDQARMLLVFSGGATAEQERDVMSGDTLSGALTEQKRLRRIEARGNSYLRSSTEGRAAEVYSADMDFDFNDDQRLQHARAHADVRARTLDSDSEMTLQTPGDVDVDFVIVAGERSLLKEMRSAGRSVVTLGAPRSKEGDPNAANKRLTADNVKLFWRTTGRDLERAEAAGNAELFVEPVVARPEADRKTLTAPRFDCEFYETGNLARSFVAQGGARAVIDPVQPTEKKGTRTLTSERMTAQFVRATQDVERIDAVGSAHFNEREKNLTSQRMNAVFGAQQALERVEAQGDAKFVERDKNGQAANITYTAADEVVRMRGGEPVVWDSRARMKAAEIDSDTRRQVSYGRGKTTTTYYSQEQTGGAAPFAKTKSPVFIASAEAEFQHETGVGIYTGGARAWQDDNFVKADRLTLIRDSKRMNGDGNVQSALYNARRKGEGGARQVVPVFATSERMFFADSERLLHYEGNVDIKQGTERITSGVADVYLLPETYEAERTIAQRNVVVTQPGRRGTGDRAEYTAADEVVVLTGSPARVEDAEKGTSESRRMTVYLREDRVVSDGGDSRQGTGRVRSTHRVKKQ